MSPRSVTLPNIAVQPGELTAVDVDGARVAVANVDGRLYAFSDVCTHEECSLSEGLLDGTVVTCPCHGAQFDVTSGRVVSPPAPTPVATYRIERRDGQVVLDV